MEAETQKHKTRQGRSMLNKRNNERETKNVELGFLGTSMCSHTQGLCMQPSCMRTHTSSMRTYAESMHTHIHPENPNLETARTQNRVETKTVKSNNLTYLRIEKICKIKLNKHLIAKTNKRNKEMEIKTEKEKKKDFEYYLKNKSSLA